MHLVTWPYNFDAIHRSYAQHPGQGQLFWALEKGLNLQHALLAVFQIFHWSLVWRNQ